MMRYNINYVINLNYVTEYAYLQMIISAIIAPV